MENVEIFRDRDALMVAAAHRIVGLAAQAIAEKGRFAWALSGGSTPRPLYTLLASPSFSKRIDWPRVHFFWSDERCVPPDRAESNYRMARETLLDAVKPPAENVHRMLGEAEPGRAAAAYERMLRRFFDFGRGGAPPSFDLILLGLGEDGHTASLFPLTPPLTEKDRWVMPTSPGGDAPRRLTLTPVVINASANIIFLVSGAPKARRLGAVLEGKPAASPAQMIQPIAGRLQWLVDADAAAQLKPTRTGHPAASPRTGSGKPR